MSLTVTDLFCGAGGSAQGAHAVPGVELRIAANHWQLALLTAPSRQGGGVVSGSANSWWVRYVSGWSRAGFDCRRSGR